MKDTKVSTRYAQSLLDLAIEKNLLNNVYADAKLINEIVASNRDFVLMLNSPVIKTDKKLAILKEILASNVNELTMKFVNLITSKKRESILDQIFESFIALYDEYKGIQKIIVTTVNGIDDGLRKKVLELVKSTTKNEIELVEKKDASIIGGFVLKIGDRQIDSSVVRTLKTLKKDLSV